MQTIAIVRLTSNEVQGWFRSVHNAFSFVIFFQCDFFLLGFASTVNNEMNIYWEHIEKPNKSASEELEKKWK